MKLYRDLHIGYYIVSLAGALGVLLPPVLREEAILLPALLALVWIVLCALAFQYLAVRRQRKILALLDECRIEEYLSQTKLLERRARGKTVYAVQINLSAGYLELGQAREALNLLQSMPESFPRGRSGTAARLCRDNNLLAAHRMLGQLEEAEAVLRRYQTDLETVRGAQKAGFAAYYRTQAMLLRMARGDFDGAIAQFEQELRTADTCRRRVAAHYDLAWALHHDGRTEEAREHLRYVAEHGGDTWYVAAARNKLEKL